MSASCREAPVISAMPGMTGPIDSVIGMKREIILERFLTQRPQPFRVATQNMQLQGLVLKIDAQGRCQEIRPGTTAVETLIHTGIGRALPVLQTGLAFAPVVLLCVFLKSMPPIIRARPPLCSCLESTR